MKGNNRYTATKTETVSSTTLAVAVAFLGAASLAAAAAGSMLKPDTRPGVTYNPPILNTQGLPPDLIISKIDINNGAALNVSGKNTITVSYQNIGKGSIVKPFSIALGSEPSGILDPNHPILAMSASVNDPVIGADNKFNLIPGETSNMRFNLSNAGTNFSGTQATLIATVDYKVGENNGVIEESKENNNSNSLSVSVVRDALGRVDNGTPVVAAPDTIKKNDPSLFCATSANNDPLICEKRFSSIDFLAAASTGWKNILKSTTCVEVYRGFPILKDGTTYEAISINAAKKSLENAPLDGCIGAIGSVASSAEAVKKCIDTSVKFAGNMFSLPNGTCPGVAQASLPPTPTPSAFCALDAATDVFVCQKRFEATTLAQTSWQGLLSTYPCAAVHKGIPIVKVGKTFAPLSWDTAANVVVSMPLTGCSDAVGDKAGSVEAVKTCLNKMDKAIVKKNGLFADAPACSN